jgi:hypothetical protein
MSNLSIVYYTANTEQEPFEKKIIDQINKVRGDVPVISVSQKPMDFGKNICVGKLKQNYQNAFYQATVGCLAADTDYVVMCEDDCLYPPGYFNFKPEKKDVIYTYDNVWLIWDREQRTRFYKHGTTAGSIIVGREFYIDFLKSGHNFKDPNLKWEKFTGEPLINIKTRKGISFGTTLDTSVKPVKRFPLWGTVDDVLKNYVRS